MHITSCPDRSWLSLFALVVAHSLALVACDSGGSNGGSGDDNESFPEPPGRPGFTSTVTGAWRASLLGVATHTKPGAFGEGTSPAVIHLRDEGAASPVITLVASRPLRPGTYEVQQPGGEGVTARVRGPDAQANWTGIRGELRVPRSGDEEIAGQFWLVAADEHGASIRVAGAFVSRSAQ